MGRKSRDRVRQPEQAPWETERTLAAAEEDAREAEERPAGTGGDLRCSCGSDHFVLQAFLAVENGVVNPVPVEAERLTCPECGREYEPVVAEGGRVLRGDYLGQFEEGEDDA